MARYRAIIEYDGTDFEGFQRQARGRTVQGELEKALQQLGWAGRSVLGAGRTDSGVHAAGQVIAFELEWRHAVEQLRNALNANLPPDVAVKEVAACAPDFHPRYSARGRWYRYSMYNTPVRAPLVARYAWQLWAPHWDMAAVRAAARQLLGRHDFVAFGNDPDGGHNTVRTVTRAEWTCHGAWMYFDIQAEAFLHRMVRNLVGALKAVGMGEMAAEAFATLLASGERRKCPPPAPPQGLCLMEVIY